MRWLRGSSRGQAASSGRSAPDAISAARQQAERPPGAEVSGGELVVEVAAGERAPHTIEFIENGVRAGSVKDRVARRALPRAGYVRAVVTRDDGKRAWVQPARL